MPTFFGRRYMRGVEAVGTTEKALGLLILVLLAGIVAAFVIQTGTNTDYLFEVDKAAYQAQPDWPAASAGAIGQGDNPFPPPGIEGWRRPRRVFSYTPDTLYEKIDGRADAYLQFHVVGLTFGTYHHQSETERMIDVYWYDMGKPENALGIYRTEASPEGTPVSFGRDGYQIGGAVFFWKGPSYVQVLPSTTDLDDAMASLEIAMCLAERIKDTGEESWALAVLPQSRRAPDSFKYIAKDAFGLDFLKDVYTADYDLDGELITLFIHRADDAASARALFDKYVRFFDDYGRVVWKEPDGSRPIVAGDVAGMIDVVFVKGRYLGGVASASNAEAARKAGVTFYQELTLP